jgi:hypothetical protein
VQEAVRQREQFHLDVARDVLIGQDAEEVLELA